MFTTLLVAGLLCGADPVPVVVPASPALVEMSKVRAEPPRATDAVLLDKGKSRFYKVANYEGPVTYELTGSSISIKEVEKATMLGIVKHGETLPSYEDVAAGSVILFGVEAGPAELSAWGIVNGKPKRLLSQSFMVRGGSDDGKKDDGKKDDGKVNPDPDVKPKPDPVVKVDKLRLILIRDTNDMGADLSQLVTDFPFWKSLSDKGHVWRFYGVTDEPAAAYLADAKDDKGNAVLPVLLVYDDKNTKKPLKVIPLTGAEKPAIEALVKEYSK